MSGPSVIRLEDRHTIIVAVATLFPSSSEAPSLPPHQPPILGQWTSSHTIWYVIWSTNNDGLHFRYYIYLAAAIYCLKIAFWQYRLRLQVVSGNWGYCSSLRFSCSKPSVSSAASKWHNGMSNTWYPGEDIWMANSFHISMILFWLVQYSFFDAKKLSPSVSYLKPC